MNSFQLTNRNILIDEKENSVEKNFRIQNLNGRSPLGGVVGVGVGVGVVKEKPALRPALRTIAIQKQAHQVQLLQQQQQLQQQVINLAYHFNFFY